MCSDCFLYGRHDSSYGQWLYHLSSTVTCGQTNQDSAEFKTIAHDILDWKLRARLLERTHVCQMTRIKLAHDSPSLRVCVFCLFFFGLDLYPYLFIYLFISLIYYYWFITQLNVSWKLEVYMANWLLPLMALKNLINYVSNTFIGIPAESNRHAFCNRFNARDISRPLWIPFAWPQELQWQSIWSSLYDTSEVKLAKIQI